MSANDSEPQAPENPKTPATSQKDEPIGLQAQTINRPKSRLFTPKFLAIIGAVLAGGVALTVYKAYNDSQINSSRIRRAPNIDTTPAGQQLAESQRYKDNLQASNNANAKEAEENGKSFLATPDEPLRDVDQKPQQRAEFRKPVAPPNEPEPAPKQEVIRQPPAPPAPPPPDYSRINQLAAAIASRASDYATAWTPVGSANTIILSQALYKTPEQRRQEALERSQATKNMPNPAMNLISAGQFAYGWVVNSTDSDTPGPVIAEILQKGPLYKARMIGTFQTNKTTSGLVIQFNRIVFPDGTETQTDAYGVDSTKGSIAVKSEVDRRLLQRYGPLIAASFIEGLGTTLAQSGSSVLYGTNYASVTQDTPSLEQGLYAGAGKVGQRMAADIEKSAPSGPLVKLNAGRTIGILFMQSVQYPQNTATVSAAATPTP